MAGENIVSGFVKITRTDRLLVVLSIIFLDSRNTALVVTDGQLFDLFKLYLKAVVTIGRDAIKLDIPKKPVKSCESQKLVPVFPFELITQISFQIRDVLAQGEVLLAGNQVVIEAHQTINGLREGIRKIVIVHLVDNAGNVRSRLLVGLSIVTIKRLFVQTGGKLLVDLCEEVIPCPARLGLETMNFIEDSRHDMTYHMMM